MNTKVTPPVLAKVSSVAAPVATVPPVVAVAPTAHPAAASAGRDTAADAAAQLEGDSVSLPDWKVFLSPAARYYKALVAKSPADSCIAFPAAELVAALPDTGEDFSEEEVETYIRLKSQGATDV